MFIICIQEAIFIHRDAIGGGMGKRLLRSREAMGEPKGFFSPCHRSPIASRG